MSDELRQISTRIMAALMTQPSRATDREIADDAVEAAEHLIRRLGPIPIPEPFQLGPWVEVEGHPCRRERLAGQALAGAMQGWFNIENWRPGMLTHPAEVASDVLDHVDALIRAMDDPGHVAQPNEPRDEIADAFDAVRYRAFRTSGHHTFGGVRGQELDICLDAYIATGEIPLLIPTAAPSVPEPPLNGVSTDEIGDDIPF